MAIDLFTSIGLSDKDEQEEIKKELLEVLRVLEGHLAARNPNVLAQRGLCLSMLPCGLEELRKKHPHLVTSSLKKVLVDLSLEYRDGETIDYRQHWEHLLKYSRGRVPEVIHRPRRMTIAPTLSSGLDVPANGHKDPASNV